MIKQEQILVLEMGGTIAGFVPEYPEVQKINEIYSQIPQIPLYITQILQHVKPEYVVRKEICRKDSRDVTEDDRENLLNSIKSLPKIDNILITHGTYTMDETGKFLLENLTDEELSQKNIIITGAMYPWNFAQSDSPANIGASLAFLSIESVNGVHICMHQRLFDPRHLKKDAENLIFLETE